MPFMKCRPNVVSQRQGRKERVRADEYFSACYAARRKTPPGPEPAWPTMPIWPLRGLLYCASEEKDCSFGKMHIDRDYTATCSQTRGFFNHLRGEPPPFYMRRENHRASDAAHFAKQGGKVVNLDEHDRVKERKLKRLYRERPFVAAARLIGLGRRDDDDDDDDDGDGDDDNDDAMGGNNGGGDNGSGDNGGAGGDAGGGGSNGDDAMGNDGPGGPDAPDAPGGPGGGAAGGPADETMPAGDRDADASRPSATSPRPERMDGPGEEAAKSFYDTAATDDSASGVAYSANSAAISSLDRATKGDAPVQDDLQKTPFSPLHSPGSTHIGDAPELDDMQETPPSPPHSQRSPLRPATKKRLAAAARATGRSETTIDSTDPSSTVEREGVGAAHCAESEILHAPAESAAAGPVPLQQPSSPAASSSENKEAPGAAAEYSMTEGELLPVLATTQTRRSDTPLWGLSCRKIAQLGHKKTGTW